MVPFQTIPPSEPFGRSEFFDSPKHFNCVKMLLISRKGDPDGPLSNYPSLRTLWLEGLFRQPVHFMKNFFVNACCFFHFLLNCFKNSFFFPIFRPKIILRASFLFFFHLFPLFFSTIKESCIILREKFSKVEL